MKKVTKQGIISIIKSVGLIPLEETWNVNVDRYYDRWTGKTEVEYEYSIKFKVSENSERLLVLNGNRVTGGEASFDVRFSSKHDKNNLEILVKAFEDNEFHCNMYVELNNKVKREVIAKISDNAGVYEEDLNAIADILGIEHE